MFDRHLHEAEMDLEAVSGQFEEQGTCIGTLRFEWLEHKWSRLSIFQKVAA
jgi:hypothetical protein